MQNLFVMSLFLLSSQLVFAGVREAQQVAENHSLCRSIQPFYWEIGNQNGKVVGDSVGGRILRNTELKIASASKLVFAAYLLEKTQGHLSAKDKSLLTMQGGYDSFNPMPCALRRTVKACFEARDNSHIDNRAENKFYYSGGNAQALAVMHGLGDLTKRELNREIELKLKNKFSLNYTNLALAGGLEMSAEDYAIFLQEVLNGTYRIKDFLGADAICTLPKDCKTSIFSPAEENWFYSYHHWVEKNSDGRVEAYSSPGARGFYPWIGPDKKIYGVLAREGLGEKAYWESVLCGREIRRAFLKK